MRIYDVSLVLIRTLVVMDFVRALAGFLFTGIRFVFLMGGAAGSAWLTRVELSSWLSPVESTILAGLLLMLSKPMARFAARFAESQDAASHF